MHSWIFVEYRFDKRADLLRIDLPSLEHLQQSKNDLCKKSILFFSITFPLHFSLTRLQLKLKI